MTVKIEDVNQCHSSPENSRRPLHVSGHSNSGRREVHGEHNVLDLHHGLWTQRRGWCDKHVPTYVPAPARKRAISIDHVLLMIDGENLFPVYLHLNDRLVPEGHPKAVDPYGTDGQNPLD